MKEDQDDIDEGMKEESKEHKSLPSKTVKTIVKDHLKMDEDYYEDDDEEEQTPVKFLKRNGTNLETSASSHAGAGKKFKKADYIDGSFDNPHASPKKLNCKWYEDHGCGC